VTGKAACRLAADRAGRVVRGIGEAPLARANVYRERKRSLGCVIGQAFHNRAGLVGDGGDRALFACARFVRKPHCTFRISRVMILVEACPREGGDGLPLRVTPVLKLESGVHRPVFDLAGA